MLSYNKQHHLHFKWKTLNGTLEFFNGIALESCQLESVAFEVLVFAYLPYSSAIYQQPLVRLTQTRSQTLSFSLSMQP